MCFVGISGSKPKKYSDIIFSCAIVSCSTILGNYFNQYHTAGVILFIIYGGLSCYLPKFKGIFNPVALNAGALMFLIYTAMPFQPENTKYYIIGSCVIFVLFLIYYIVRNNFYKSISEEAQKEELECIACSHIAVIIVISIIVGHFINRLIAGYYPLSHSYWISLSILVIIQNTYRKTIIICIKRILVNFAGAVIAVICFLYMFPNSAYFNFIFLIVIMFFIFLFGSSYTLRVIFIEIFIFGLALFNNRFFISTGVERVVDTIIGGVIVLVVTTGYVYILNILKEKKLS
jgi:hypothetical protein